LQDFEEASLLRQASLCFAKASSASRAKEPLDAGKNRFALKSGEPADRFEEPLYA